MSNRKATPDILGEILGAPPASAPAIDRGNRGAAPPVAPAAQPARRPKRRKPPAEPKPPARTTWEYMTVILADHNGWRPRLINDTELDNWKYQPLLRDLLTIVGAYGWELTAVIDTGRHTKEAYFKRPG